MTLRAPVSFQLALLVATACAPQLIDSESTSSSSAGRSPNTPSGGAGSAGTPGVVSGAPSSHRDGDGGAIAAGGTGSISGAGNGSGGVAGSSPDDGIVTCDETPLDAPPGPPLVNGATLGSGVCAGKTLDQVIQAVVALRPDLASITRIYDVNKSTYPGSFIYAFQKTDGGFAIVFMRGTDPDGVVDVCVDGCSKKEYWYFETDASCGVVAVGHYLRPPFANDCIPVDQRPLWGRPATPPPAAYCGANVAAEDVSGTYDVAACGNHTPCDVTGKGELIPVLQKLRMIIAQDPGNLAIGTVTFVDSGLPELDNTPIPVGFTRRGFTGKLSFSNLPAVCPWQRDVTVNYDFERATPSSLDVRIGGTPDCAQPDQYCKGFLGVKLGPSPAK